MLPLAAATADDDDDSYISIGGASACSVSSSSALHDLHRTIRASHRSHGLSSTALSIQGAAAAESSLSSTRAALGESLFNMSIDLTSALADEHLDQDVMAAKRPSRAVEASGVVAPSSTSRKRRASLGSSSHRRTPSLDRIGEDSSNSGSGVFSQSTPIDNAHRGAKAAESDPTPEKEEEVVERTKDKIRRRSMLSRQPSVVRRATDISAAVFSADETLAQLEAFLHSDDSQANVLLGPFGDDDDCSDVCDDDDVSLRSELRRLSDGEDETRRELEELRRSSTGEIPAASWMNDSGSSWRMGASFDAEDEKEEEEGSIQRPVVQEWDKREDKEEENIKGLSVALGGWSSADVSTSSQAELSLKFDGRIGASSLVLSAFHPSGTSLERQGVFDGKDVKPPSTTSPTRSVDVPSGPFLRNTSMVSVLTLDHDCNESCGDDCDGGSIDNDDDKRGEERKGCKISTPLRRLAAGEVDDSSTLMSPIGTEVSVFSSSKSLMESPSAFIAAPSARTPSPLLLSVLHPQDGAVVIAEGEEDVDDEDFFHDAFVNEDVLFLHPEIPTPSPKTSARGDIVVARSGKSSGGKGVNVLEFLLRGAEKLANLLYGW